MSALARVELQAEVGRPRDQVFELVSTPAGFCRWLDGAEMEPSVGADVRLVLANAVAVGTVLAVAAPQHISFSWDWEAEPLGRPSVVAFDMIDHAPGTHMTLRQVGLRPGEPLLLHEALWHHWFPRLVEAAEAS